MRKSGGQGGYTLIEMTIVMAITTVIVVPLAGIASSMVFAPARASGQVLANNEIRNFSLLLVEDSLSAQSFAPGEGPEPGTAIDPEATFDYGTFSWLGFSGSTLRPRPVSARYFLRGEKIFREAKFAEQSAAPHLVLSGVEDYGDVTFELVEAAWEFDEIGKSWNYTTSKMVVVITFAREAGAKFSEVEFTTRIVTAFRPQTDRPVEFPTSTLLRPPPEISTVPVLLDSFRLSVPGNDKAGGITLNQTLNPPALWVVDEKANAVFEYTLEGTLVDEFSLTSANGDSKGITTDGTSPAMPLSQPRYVSRLEGPICPAADRCSVYPAADLRDPPDLTNPGKCEHGLRCIAR